MGWGTGCADTTVTNSRPRGIGKVANYGYAEKLEFRKIGDERCQIFVTQCLSEPRLKRFTTLSLARKAIGMVDARRKGKTQAS